MNVSFFEYGRKTNGSKNGNWNSRHFALQIVQDAYSCALCVQCTWLAWPTQCFGTDNLFTPTVIYRPNLRYHSIYVHLHSNSNVWQIIFFSLHGIDMRNDHSFCAFVVIFSVILFITALVLKHQVLWMAYILRTHFLSQLI